MSRWAVEMAEALRGDGSSGTDGPCGLQPSIPPR